MSNVRLAHTPSTIGRIQGADPPLLGQDFLGDTLIALPWRQIPHEAYCPPMRHHIIGGVFQGDGTTAVKVEAKRLQVQSQSETVIINPRGTDGFWHCVGSPLVSNVFLGEDRLQQCTNELGGGERPELLLSLQIHDPTLFAILKLIADETAVEDAIDKLYLEQLIDALCLQLLRRHSAASLTQIRAGGLSPSQVKKVMNYMQDHLAEDIRIQNLSDLVGRSKFHFCRAFRLATGSTPHQALTQLRIHRARQMLRQGTLSITEIALSVGYQTPSSFALAFRAAVGETPSRYRRHFLGDVLES